VLAKVLASFSKRADFVDPENLLCAYWENSDATMQTITIDVVTMESGSSKGFVSQNSHEEGEDGARAESCLMKQAEYRSAVAPSTGCKAQYTPWHLPISGI
jgi:hypothetical protein